MRARNGREIVGPGVSREQDLWLIAHGYETGCWDERGDPVPWPEGLVDRWPPEIPDAGRWQEARADDWSGEITDQGEPPF
jgi:hypothetical protein